MKFWSTPRQQGPPTHGNTIRFIWQTGNGGRAFLRYFHWEKRKFSPIPIFNIALSIRRDPPPSKPTNTHTYTPNIHMNYMYVYTQTVLARTVYVHESRSYNDVKVMVFRARIRSNSIFILIAHIVCDSRAYFQRANWPQHVLWISSLRDSLLRDADAL